MLSICIPVYNHSFLALSKDLHQQCLAANISFEIIVSNDNSSDKTVDQEAQQFCDLAHTRYNKNQVNKGNDLNRNLLAEMAQYSWLLFLDADTMPLNQDFISLYLKQIQQNPADAYSGGIVYDRLQNPNHILKWKHGKKAEEVKENLKEDDFLGFRGNNFLIKKEVFLEVPFLRLAQNYGYVDTVFGINLKMHGYKVKLIHNPVIHLGLIDAKTFLEKTKKAVENAYYLDKNYPEIGTKIKLIRSFRKLRKFKLVSFIASIFSKYQNKLIQNLQSSNPDLFYFKLYKLGYMCTLATQNLSETSED